MLGAMSSQSSESGRSAGNSATRRWPLAGAERSSCSIGSSATSLGGLGASAGGSRLPKRSLRSLSVRMTRRAFHERTS